MTSENLGEFLTGNRIETSPYSIYMQHNISCSALCRVSSVMPTCVFVVPLVHQTFKNHVCAQDGMHPTA